MGGEVIGGRAALPHLVAPFNRGYMARSPQMWEIGVNSC